MDKNKISSALQRIEKPLAAAFVLFSILFLVLALTGKYFFEWAFARHQNQFRWYVRPL